MSITSSYLRINDIELDVPPTSIAIGKYDFNASVATLRSQTSTYIKSGRRSIDIVIKTYFATGYNAESQFNTTLDSWVNRQLSPLLIQIRKCPFVSIENEKIRREVFSGASESQIQSLEKTNMAAVVKSVQLEANAKDPELINMTLHLKWFNYLPFSKDFKYKRVDENGNEFGVDIPDNQFQEYINSGTRTTFPNFTSITPPSFVNSWSPNQPNDLELIYKEYYNLSEEEETSYAINQIESLGLNLDESEERMSSLKRAEASNPDKINKMLQEGWQFVDDFQSARRVAGRKLFRYRKFTIKSIGPEETINSGRLLVESVGAMLETKTPEIPLLGHTIPTAQFLGVSDASFSFNIFANAELEGSANDGRPVGTSYDLARLNAIINNVATNAVRHRRVSKNDSLFVRHPVAKLFKYKRYDEKRVPVYNEDTQRVEQFYPGEYVSCIVQKTDSATVEGHPFCSRFTIILSENYRSDIPNLSQENKGYGNRAYQATTELVKEMVGKFQITKDDSQGAFVMPSSAPVGDPEYPIALELLQSLNDTLLYKDYPDPLSVLNDKDVIERRQRDIRSDIISSSTQPIIRDVATGQLKTSRTINPISSDSLNKITWDLLKITSKAKDDDPRFTVYKKPSEVFRNYNLVEATSCYPDMMLPDDTIRPDFYFYNESDRARNRYKRKLLEGYRGRLEKVGQQYTSKTADKDAGKEIDVNLKESYGPPTPAANVVELGSEKERPEAVSTDKGFTQNPLDVDQQFANAQRTLDDFQDNTYTMRRTMPTFKLFVKENDLGSLNDVDKDRIGRLSSNGLWRNFAEFYDINAIVDIRLVKEKSNPAHLLVIRMTNTKGDIVNETYNDLNERTKSAGLVRQKTKPPGGETTGKQKAANVNQLDDVMLKEGTKIELRLGYESDPNLLDVEFSGRIAQIGGGDVVEIVCQGDGVELIQDLKGVGTADEFTWNSDTANVISELLHNSPEVKSFGGINAKTGLGDIELFWRSAGGRSAVENIFAPSLYGSWQNFGDKSIRYTSIGLGLGTLVGGPPGAALGTAIGFGVGLLADIKDGIYTLFRGVKFTIYEQTIWDVLQELTMRHPGTICSVVPFDKRSTIFFGYPDQLYFNRGATFDEAAILAGDSKRESFALPVERNIAEFLRAKTGGKDLTKVFTKKELRESVAELENGRVPPKTKYIGTGATFDFSDERPLVSTNISQGAEIALSMMRQFRRYHLITSEHDIIDNGMRVNSDDVYNSIQVVYPEEDDDGNFDGSVGFSDYKTLDDIRGDDDLNRDFIKRQTLVFHNAHTEIDGVNLPEKYGISALCSSLNNVYRGRIKILGRSGIKPHDVVFVYDSYNGIYGAVEVDSVIQTFSYQTGWITEIIPHMVVTPTTSTAIVHIAAVQRVITSYYLKNMKAFYGSPVFSDTTDEELESEGLGSSLLDAGTNLAAISASGIIGKQGLKDFRRIRAAKKLVNSGAVVSSQVTRKLAAASLPKFILARSVATGLPIIGDLVIDYAIGWYNSWSRLRQPIMFLPVTRNGKPWYTGLYGLQNNTEVEAIQGQFADVIEKGDYFVEYLKDEFPEVFE